MLRKGNRLPSGVHRRAQARTIPAGHVELYRSFRANFTYDVIPIALFQAPIYVTSANEALM